MPRSIRSPAGRAAAPTLVAAALSLALIAPASAEARDGDGQPVTTADTVRVEGLGTNGVDVLTNDTDPDGDDLAICRVAAPEGAPIFVAIDDQSIYVTSTANRTADYEVTYYACDFEHLTAGTLTVQVTRTPLVRATKLRKPGRLKFINPSDKRVVVFYGSRREKAPDGRFGLRPHSSNRVTVDRKRIYFVSFVRRTGALAGQGFIKNITLPRQTHERTNPSSFGPTALGVWSDVR